MALVDHLGRPVSTAILKERILEEELSRSGGARVFGGEHPSQGLTPQRLASLLRQAEEGDPVSYFALAEEMEEKDLHYLSVLQTRKRQVAQLNVTVEPGDDNDQASIGHADLVREAIEGCLDEDVLFDMLDAVGKGLSVTEIIWDRSANQYMPCAFDWVDPRMIDFDAQRRRPMLKMAGGPEPLKPFKFIVPQIRAKSGLPIRSGLARPIAWAYLFKNYDIKDWVRFAEAYGQPLRVGKFHAGASEAEKRSLLRSVAALGSDAAAVIPQAMAIEFIEAKSQGSAADLFEGLANYMDRQVSKAVLGQTATTDAIAGGHAVGKEHDKVRGDIERADARVLAAAIVRDLVKAIVDLNFGPQRRYPKVMIGREDEADAKLMIEAAEKLVPMGLKVRQADIRKAVGFEEADDDDDVLVQPRAAPPEPDPIDPKTPPAKKAPATPLAPPRLSAATASAEGVPYSPYSSLNGGVVAGRGSPVPLPADPAPDRDQFDALAEQLLAETMDAQTEWIEQIRAVVQDPAVTSLAEAGRRLLGLKPALSAAALADALGDALVLAEHAGRNDIAGL